MILVVDDHDDTRGFLVQMLKLSGYDVASAGSGAVTLLILETERPSLIILDFNMPTMTGHDVLKTMRADERWKDIPVILYSNDGSPERAEQSMRLGAQAHVRKMMLSWEEFRAVIDQYRADAA